VVTVRTHPQNRSASTAAAKVGNGAPATFTFAAEFRAGGGVGGGVVDSAQWLTQHPSSNARQLVGRDPHPSNSVTVISVGD
jgi:hypothetical protein